MRAKNRLERKIMKQYFLIGIDPGTTETAYCIIDYNNKILNEVLFKDKIKNDAVYYALKTSLKDYIKANNINHIEVLIAIEHIENHGMAVGSSTFETCYFIGELNYRLKNELMYNLLKDIQELKTASIDTQRVYRHQEKTAICYNSRAKDSNIRQALIDTFGIVGTKNNQGYFYGFKSDIWSSFAIAYTYHLLTADQEQ